MSDYFKMFFTSLDAVVFNGGVFACLMVASWFIFYRLCTVLFYDGCNRHDTPSRWKRDGNVSRFGGVGVFIMFVLIIALWQGPMDTMLRSHEFLMALALVFVTGLVDDLQSVTVKKRMFSYLASSVAVGLVLIECSPPISLWYFALAVFVVFFFINSFNFLDNMDLVCCGNSLIIMVWLCVLSGDWRLLIWAVMLVPFIRYNNNGHLHLGDCGSTVLGFTLSSMAMWLWLVKGVPLHSLALVFIVPLADTLFVLTRRIVEKRRPWVGGTDHLTHALARWQGEPNVWPLTFTASILGGMLGVLFL